MNIKKRLLFRLAADAETDEKKETDENEAENDELDDLFKDDDINDNNDDNDTNDSNDDDFYNDFDFDINDDDDIFSNSNNKSDLEKMITNDTTRTVNTQQKIQYQLFDNIFHNLANDGRGVLKRIEEYKYKIIQSSNAFNGNEELKTKIEQKKKILESAAAQIYGIVFDLENYDLTPNYAEEQLSLSSMPEQEGFNEDSFDFVNEQLDENDNENEEDNENENNDQNENDDDELEMQGGFDDDSFDFSSEDEEVGEDEEEPEETGEEE